MKKLIQILAFSAGGGLLVGAGLRLAEKRAGETGFTGGSADTDEKIALFLDRLEALERKIDSPPPSQSPQPDADRPFESMRAPSSSDFQAEISAQISAMEDRLRRDLGSRNEDRIASLSDEIHKRLDLRMEPIEREIAVQRSTVNDLKEYSLRTERSLQKLLEGVDRLVSAQGPRVGGPVAG